MRIGHLPIQFGGTDWHYSTGIFANTATGNIYKKQTFAHEIGHAVGLAHNIDFSYMTIMRPDLATIPRTVTGPWFNDLYGINYLYK
ncbi:reprolysin-like metallopeptidase [Lactobacillus terrae]|uniref:reprolysin-like metallopeptidase n=1 Tax=Lactobacillus terrae TaxID=2269374 RepID=UPI0010FCE3AD